MDKTDKVSILLVDDEEDILEFLSYNLTKEGYEVRIATSGKKAIKIAQKWIPDVVILDVMMPEMDGIEACTIMREDKTLEKTLIVFLTARNESFTHISALEAGGDDFINKPIKPNVLKSRLKALVRRHYRFQHQDEEGKTKQFGDLIINYDEFKVTINNVDILLVKKEFHLLALLVSKPGKVFKRAVILNKVWGHDVIVGDRTIDVHVRKLREKIGKGYIKTLKGVGYKFKY